MRTHARLRDGTCTTVYPTGAAFAVPTGARARLVSPSPTPAPAPRPGQTPPDPGDDSPALRARLAAGSVPTVASLTREGFTAHHAGIIVQKWETNPHEGAAMLQGGRKGLVRVRARVLQVAGFSVGEVNQYEHDALTGGYRSADDNIARRARARLGRDLPLPPHGTR